MLTIILLALVFLAVVVPQAWSARAERQREFLDSIQLSSVGGATAVDTGLRTAPAPRPRSSVARRKTILVFLLVSMAVTVVPLLVNPSKVTLAAQLAVDNCFLAYVGLLVRWRDARSPLPGPASVTDLGFNPPAVQPVLRVG